MTNFVFCVDLMSRQLSACAAAMLRQHAGGVAALWHEWTVGGRVARSKINEQYVSQLSWEMFSGRRRHSDIRPVCVCVWYAALRRAVLWSPCERGLSAALWHLLRYMARDIELQQSTTRCTRQDTYSMCLAAR